MNTKIISRVLVSVAFLSFASVSRVDAASGFTRDQIKTLYQKFNNNNATQKNFIKAADKYKTVLIASQAYTTDNDPMQTYSPSDKMQFANQINNTTDIPTIFKAMGYDYNKVHSDAKNKIKSIAEKTVRGEAITDPLTPLEQLTVSTISYKTYYDPDSEQLNVVAKFKFQPTSYIKPSYTTRVITINSKGDII